LPPQTLIVEDKDSLRAMLRHALEGQSYPVIEAKDEPEATEILRKHRPAVVLTDLRLPRGDGFGVLRAAREVDPETSVIVMTAYGSIEDAVTAMKAGAMDFLAKPIDPDRLLLLVSRALDRHRIVTENILLKEELAVSRGLPEIIGQNEALKKVIATLRRAATSDATVLLGGESGTGKELFARALHAFSDRADGPFVAINCAAIPETLLESELFGHEKGAFTGAVARKPGKFEVAHRGTLFLDEIGDLPLALQAKILRAIEERRFERVGGNSSLQVDVRLVAATNKDLRAAVTARRFREDLFFRLSVFPITVPPLRERVDDIPILTRHFIGRFCRDLKKPVIGITPEAEQVLTQYAWPGNVRELQNCIERAVILNDTDEIQTRHLSLSSGEGAMVEGADNPWDLLDLSGTLEEASVRIHGEFERHKLAATMRLVGGDTQAASEELKISHRDLLQRLKRHHLSR
jgi:DNA-binding NtrC family response regulator